MSVFRPATLGGIESSKNVANFKATAETKLGALVKLNHEDKEFTTVASVSEAKNAVYALWQYASAEFHSVLGTGTNYHNIKAGEFGRLLYLPSLVGIVDGIEIGGDIIATGTYAIGDVLVANASGLYEKTADASEYAISFVIRDIIDEYDGKRYICEVNGVTDFSSSI